MSWTETVRCEHDGSRLRYASDCAEREWVIIAPLLARTTKVGCPRLHRAQNLWKAKRYIAVTGCQWAQLPKDFSPFTTLRYHFYQVRDSGLLDVISAVVVAGVQVPEGREAESTAGIIDIQPVKNTEAGGPRAMMPPRRSMPQARHRDRRDWQAAQCIGPFR